MPASSPATPPVLTAGARIEAQKAALTQAPKTDPGESRVGVVIGSVAVLMLLAALDQTIVSTALPTIVADLGGLDHLSWVVTAYMLASTVVAPLYGKLGDLYGRRTIVIFAVCVFLLGSMLCGVANSMTFLILARALQGLGGGGLFVLALSIIGDVIPPRERGKVQGVFAGVFGVASVAGPLLGGWFVQALSWHWIFFVNLPFGILALAGFIFGFRANPERVSHKIDYAGALALSVTLAGIVLVTSLGGSTLAFSDPVLLAILAAALLGFLAFILAERRAVEPVLPLDLFKNNVFLVTSIVSLLSGAMMFGALTYIPIYLQIAKGTTPTQSGLQLISMTFGILTASNIAGRYMGKTGKYKALPIIGFTLGLVAMLMLTQLDASTSSPYLWGALLLLGAGMGSIFPVVTTAVQNAVPKNRLGTATAAGLMFRQVGGSVAVAFFGALFAVRMAASMGGSGESAALGNVAELGPQMISGLSAQAQAALAANVSGALHPIYYITAVLCALGLAMSFFLKEIPLTNRHVPKGE
ncbi:Multidrug resistance protein 3 [Aquimixticola soesokkakensis]|uniref:Multidrug resistance protein 3 n=1 Tax=Aquimixticola soesokkakensis TaxID=1519096 RepID=A0A1Y5S9B8_9RHOB|nr:MDR family MFS transporter [Aquimixticola soesokkakensis]SLN35410.1 Multidrug resistance protein 3 [Aquimixticola soesokkakensis]